MKSALYILSLFALTLLPTVVMAQDRPFVITEEGNRVNGTALEADRQGNLTLTLVDGRVKRRFRKGTYRAAYVPRPDIVRKLQAAFSQGEFDYIDQNAEAALQEYGYLGWGDMIMYIQAKVALDRQKPQQALEYLKRGQEYPGIHDELTQRALAETYVALEDYDKAGAIIDRALKGTDSQIMLTALFNLRGDMLAAQGRRKEAVLEYMKTVLLFDKGSVGRNYEQARDRMVDLMKGMNDLRYKEFENL